MGEVVSLEDYKAKHSPGYIRGVILDSKVDRTPEKPPTRYGWNKEESDKKVAEDRRHANESVFYGLVPRPLLYPMVALSTMATVIASQAMITGVFSLTQQPVQLGYFPRVRIVHTSSETQGQIYVPQVNYALMLACIGLVLAFRESSRLAGAYGIAVTATMGITSVLYFFVTTRTWGWPLWKSIPLVAMFLAFDSAYFGSNLLKIVDGGWFTLAVAAAITVAMTTWRDGRSELSKWAIRR